MDAQPADPALGQTEKTISIYLSKCSAGDAVAIRNTQGIGVAYLITVIEDINQSKGRLYTATPSRSGGKAWYRKTGENCFHPKGQSRLVEPTEAVRNFASRYPMGRMVDGEVNLVTGQRWVSELGIERLTQNLVANRHE